MRLVSVRKAARGQYGGATANRFCQSSRIQSPKLSPQIELWVHSTKKNRAPSARGDDGAPAGGGNGGSRSETEARVDRIAVPEAGDRSPRVGASGHPGGRGAGVADAGCPCYRRGGSRGLRGSRPGVGDSPGPL